MITTLEKNLNINIKMTIRINKFLAQYSDLSRRKADDYIKRGKVMLNGSTAQNGDQVDPDNDEVEIIEKNRPIAVGDQKLKKMVVLMYKPSRIICSKSDEKGRETIYDLLPEELKENNLKYAGRLDYMSEGLVVLSNDGDFIQRMTHPKYNKTKEYLVKTDKKMTSDQMKAIEKGIKIDGYKTKPVTIIKPNEEELELVGGLSNEFWYKFFLKEGRNQQIRKSLRTQDVFAAKLIRISHGDYRLKSNLRKDIYEIVDNLL